MSLRNFELFDHEVRQLLWFVLNPVTKKATRSRETSSLLEIASLANAESGLLHNILIVIIYTPEETASAHHFVFMTHARRTRCRYCSLPAVFLNFVGLNVAV